MHFSENFILPISHDEVVHGKCSLINKMPGNNEQKLAGIRAFMGYMMAHPGKNSSLWVQNFVSLSNGIMSRNWIGFCLLIRFTKKQKHFFQSLNHFYLNTPSLWEVDFFLGRFFLDCPR